MQIEPGVIWESMSDAFYSLDADWNFTYVNATAERLLKRQRADLLGKSLWAEFPASIDSPFHEHYRTAMATGQAERFEEYAPHCEVWVEVDAYPLGGGLHVYFRDITQRRSSEAKQVELHRQLEERQLQDIAESKQAEQKLKQANENLEARVTTRTLELAGTNQALQKEVAERQHTLGALKTVLDELQVSREEAIQARREAEAANAAKSEFLSRMSHELRTPLNAILGFGQVLEMDEMPPKRRAAVEHILTAGGHLLDLINEVLDISRIEAGQMSLSLEPVSAAIVIREVLDLVQPMVARSGITVTNELIGYDEWHILADRQRLKQTVLNLVANAIKYNRPGGAVIVSGQIDEQAKMLCLRVRDTGFGISEEDRARLFRPFERLGADATRIEGTGIGLALSKSLTEAMGGTIGLDSVVGEGSTFWLEFPLVPSPLQAESATVEATEPVPNLRENGQSRLVLYIEDNLANLQLVEALFAARTGVRLISAMQGTLGLELARQHHPELILLDLHLPDIKGDEVLRRLRADDSTRHIPVMIISADATAPQIERLLAGGAMAFLTKPINVKEFLRKLDEVFADS